MCPTFPRSGNTFLMLVLRDYFGKDRFHFADSHRHPGRVFGVDPKCVFQKTHDFDLSTPVSKKYQYLVQVRHPFAALASWQALKQRENGMNMSVDTWWRQRMQFYADFVKRWVLKPIDHRVVLDYDDLMANPVNRIAGVVIFLTRKAEVDRARLQDIIDARFKPSRRTYQTPFKRL